METVPQRNSPNLAADLSSNCILSAFGNTDCQSCYQWRWHILLLYSVSLVLCLGSSSAMLWILGLSIDPAKPKNIRKLNQVSNLIRFFLVMKCVSFFMVLPSSGCNVFWMLDRWTFTLLTIYFGVCLLSDLHFAFHWITSINLVAYPMSMYFRIVWCDHFHATETPSLSVFSYLFRLCSELLSSFASLFVVWISSLHLWMLVVQ